MNNLQLGKMYCMKQYFWFVFPTKKVAGELQWASAWVSVAEERAEKIAQRAALNAKMLSEDYNCNVDVVEPNTCVVLLEVDEDERCYKLLDCNGNIGWIYCWDDFSKYFDPVKE